MTTPAREGPREDPTWLYVAIVLPVVAGITLLVWNLTRPEPPRADPPARRDVCEDRAFGMANHRCNRWRSAGDPSCIKRRFDLPDEECIRWKSSPPSSVGTHS